MFNSYNKTRIHNSTAGRQSTYVIHMVMSHHKMRNGKTFPYVRRRRSVNRLLDRLRYVFECWHAKWGIAILSGNKSPTFFDICTLLHGTEHVRKFGLDNDYYSDRPIRDANGFNNYMVTSIKITLVSIKPMSRRDKYANYFRFWHDDACKTACQ